MDIRVLKYFITVAKEENITKAAKILQLTQPTLSRQLHQLEEDMDVKLFRRSRHSIILTEEGKLLLKRAKEIVKLCDTAREEVTQQGIELRGEIGIGCGETSGMLFLADQMVLFQKKYPLVRFKIYSAIADDIKERLEKGILNIGLLTEPVDVEKYEYIRVRHKDQWGVLTRKDSELAKKGSLLPKDLLGEPLILPVRDKVRGELASWFGDYSEQLRVVATCNLVLNAAAMVKQGLGSAVCFNLPVYDEELCFIPLSPILTTGSVLVWKSEQKYDLAVMQFLKQLRNAK